MGHLAICNNKTVKEILETGYVSTRGVLKSMPVKTISDLFSDALATRKGDLIFPWIIKSNNNDNIGFRYILKVDGPPIYVLGEFYPIKIPINKKIIKYEMSLCETDALDLFRSELLWNAIGKKSLGRGRSLTHQTLLEDNLLTNLLNNLNDNKYEEISISRVIYENAINISIDLNNNNWNNGFLEKLSNVEEYDRITSLELPNIPWSKNGYFSYEKTFEAWLMENIDNKNCKQLWNLLNIYNPQIIWFGNYLPFGVAGSNIDTVIMVKDENIYKLIVIELKNNELNLNGYSQVANQVLEYSKFIKNAFASFIESPKFIIIPLIIAAISDDINNNEKIFKDEFEIKWFGYDIVNGIVNFNNQIVNP